MQAHRPTTEGVDPRFADLDAWPLGSAMDAMWEGQMAAAAAVRPALPALAAASEAAAAALGDHGRIVYVGAGTSGRVAVQDGAELPPTFDWPMDRLVFAMAGGEHALLRSVEGAEDDAEAGVARMDAAQVGPCDVVIGVAASGTTPFTVAAVERAAALGSVTIGISCNAATPLLTAARHPVLILTGSELIAGSTRMKAGTSQKIALNLISTGMMIRLGRVHGGMMVNMHVSNAKLRRRGADMVARIAGCGDEAAERALEASGGNVKLAAMMALGVGRDAAQRLLAAHNGVLRLALGAVPETKPPGSGRT
jgi:N-acetylmuramic acid 6-phosphate etherase